MAVFLVASIILNSIILALIMLIYFALRKVISENKVTRGQDIRHIRAKIAKKLEKDAQSQLVKILATFSQSLERQARAHLTMVTDDASRKSRDLAEFVKDQEKTVVLESQYLLASDLSKVKDELEAYKKNQLKAIDAQINAIIAKVAREVVGKTIDISTHQQLVMQALEKAKAENFFTNE